VPEILLEIGCEELPASWLEGLGGQLRQRFLDAAGRERLGGGDTRVFWTPRRLGLAAGLVERQEDREETIWGPSLAVARNAGGWTQAALGFARKGGLSADDLRQGPKDASSDETYLFFVRRTPGRATREVLPAVIAQVLRGLAFPKRMSWDAWLDDGKGLFPFGRPIRWIVAVLGGEVVPFTIHTAEAGGRGRPLVRAGAETRGHRFLPRGSAGRPLPVSSLADLQARLREGFVLLDPAERERRIGEGLRRENGGRDVQDDHGLALEWRDLVEYPTVVAGRIPGEFRSLPVEVLQTVLIHHQKYVPLATDGAVERFAAVVNSDESNSAEIVRGMERVVVARLRDAAFFFAEDRRRGLADRVGDLAGVTLHQGLGSYLDKAERMVRLVDAMGGGLRLLTRPEHEAARQAARLAKADLTTLMVREFPELQGTMGGIYLRAEGTCGNDVVSAVRWHYHPVSVEETAAPHGQVRGSDATVFAAVSLADKLDTLAGYLGLGEAPTGSRDPYGLRRAGQGAVRVALDFWSPGAGRERPSLRRLVPAALAGYEGRFRRPAAEIEGDLFAFLLDRLEYVLATRFPREEVEAVVHTPGTDALEDPHDCLVRLEALHRVRAERGEDFEHLAVAFKRAKNILLDQPPPGAVQPVLFRSEAERELHDAVARLGTPDGGPREGGSENPYDARLRSLAALRAPVDRFFDDVLVMAEEAQLRVNRLGLLQQTLSLFYRIADISKLGGTA
jgi:glycyl-tRNA synthetase beta chain